MRKKSGQGHVTSQELDLLSGQRSFQGQMLLQGYVALTFFDIGYETQICEWSRAVLPSCL